MTNQRINDVDTITTISSTDRLLVNTDATNNVLEQIEKDDFVADIISTDANNAIEVGTDNKLTTSSDVTLQGNTFNGNSQLIQTNSSGQYPALDGSLITNISSGGGGVVDFDNKGTVTTDITLAENKITTGYWSGTNTITLPTITDTTKQVTCILDFTTATSGQPSITNNNLKWSDKNSGNAPSAYSILGGVQNLLVFKSVWIGSTLYWEAEYSTYGAVETSFTFPNLTADGTLGGVNAAVSASPVQSGTSAYQAVDNNSTNTFCGLTTLTASYIWYNPTAFKVTQYNYINRHSDTHSVYVPTAGTFYYSDDGTNWVLEQSFTNSVTSENAYWNVPISLANQGFHKYRKAVYTATSGAYDGVYYSIRESRPIGYIITT